MDNYRKICMILTFSGVKCDTISTLKNCLIYSFSFFLKKSFFILIYIIYIKLYLNLNVICSFHLNIFLCLRFSAKMPIFVPLMKLVMLLTWQYVFVRSITNIYFFLFQPVLCTYFLQRIKTFYDWDISGKKNCSIRL